MKNLLAIEIKDNRTIVTLTKFINGKHNLMYHKSYEFTPLSKTLAYDVSIVKKIKDDLNKMELFDSIDETSLAINTKKVVVQTFKKEYRYDADLKLEKQKIVDDLKEKRPDWKILKCEFPYENSGFTKKIVNSTIESIEAGYLEEIISAFKFHGIKINKLIPMIDIIKESTKNIAINNGITFVILVEEKFTQLTTFENGSISFSTKWDYGLTNIYDYISKKMDIKKNVSKKIFEYFGSIPPEDVVDDKVIHTKKHGNETEIFTKKDLSTYITEKVNELFSNVKKEFDFISKEKNRKIIFSGEIKSLTGFKKYAMKSFAEKNINKFKSEIIGLNEETEFITLGMLNIIQEKKVNKKDEINESKLTKPKISVINKFIRMYNYI